MADTTDATSCPVCGAELAYSVLVHVPPGAKFPDDADHTRGRETTRDVRCCEECGTMYDPVLAG